MSKFNNRKRDCKLAGISATAPSPLAPQLAKHCKFNFYYLMPEGEYSLFACPSWGGLLERLKAFCEHPLAHWQQVTHNHSKILVNYGAYPSNSRIPRPTHVPEGVIWARFHLTGMCVLAGFVIPPDWHGESPDNRDLAFDKNTFYVVFLDQNHDFYPSKR